MRRTGARSHGELRSNERNAAAAISAPSVVSSNAEGDSGEDFDDDSDDGTDDEPDDGDDRDVVDDDDDDNDNNGDDDNGDTVKDTGCLNMALSPLAPAREYTKATMAADASCGAKRCGKADE